MKYLFLVHVEEPFRSNFKPNLIGNIRRTISNHPNIRVIHFTSHVDSFEPIKEIKKYIHQEIEWGWGYEKDSFNEYEQNFVIRCGKYSLHPSTWIPPFLRKWNKKDSIILGGGCENECLGGMVAILEYLKLPYKKNQGIVY
jgi:hypothetical protein